MPRAGLNKEKVFRAAIQIANEEGYDQMSLGRLAGAFGIKTPSLYKHVKNLQEIQEHLALLGHEGIQHAFVLGARKDKTPEEQFQIMANEYRKFALDNPGLYAASLPTHLSRGKAVQQVASETLKIAFQMLRDFGIPEKALLDRARFIRSALHGFVNLELAGGFGMPRELDLSYQVLIDSCLRAMSPGFESK